MTGTTVCKIETHARVSLVEMGEEHDTSVVRMGGFGLKEYSGCWKNKENEFMKPSSIKTTTIAKYESSASGSCTLDLTSTVPPYHQEAGFART